MLGADTLIVGLVSAAVEFVLHGNEQEVLGQIGLPSLPATIQFNGEVIRGSHQGPREKCGGVRKMVLFGAKCFNVEANGEGKFNSSELAYSGNFFHGKFHDLTGNATCCFGLVQKYTGYFEDGHLSGYGVMENCTDGVWWVGFRGAWRKSKPYSGTQFDRAGRPIVTFHDGVVTGGGDAAPKEHTPADASPPPKELPSSAPVFVQGFPVLDAWPADKRHNTIGPTESGAQVVPMKGPSAGGDGDGGVLHARTGPVATALPLWELAQIDDRILRMLANPSLHLSLEDSLAVLMKCVELGRVNAHRISGKTAVMVVGNTGAGKSTFLNFLVGCTMESKSARSMNVKGAVGNVVVVKPVSEGGRRDELVKIGHGKISQTFLPNVLIDDETELCFCDCPGFLDNRGAEINIANAVNLITTLSQAKEVKVVVLISYDTIKADRGRGLSELITVCTKLFGSVDKLKQHMGCLLIGCSLFDHNNCLKELKETLSFEAPPIMADLVERLFLIDVLASHEGWWDREECIEQIKSMPAIANPADVFHTVLLASDEKKLIAIGTETKRRIAASLSKWDYVKCHELYRMLDQLSAIKHITVERIVRDCYLYVSMHFMKESFTMKEHCQLAAFAEAKHVLERLQSAAAVFRGEEWTEVLPLDQLQSFYDKAQSRHTEQVQRDKALQLQLQQAGNQIDFLTAALLATKEEAARKEQDHRERFAVIKSGFVEQLEYTKALSQASQQALEEELSARLLAKDEEIKRAEVLNQQDVKVRLSAERQVIGEEYRQLLKSSEQKYTAVLQDQKKMEQLSLADHQRPLEEARKERESAEKRIKELKHEQRNGAKRFTILYPAILVLLLSCFVALYLAVKHNILREPEVTVKNYATGPTSFRITKSVPDASEESCIINLGEIQLFYNNVRVSPLGYSITTTHEIHRIANCFDRNANTFCHTINYPRCPQYIEINVGLGELVDQMVITNRVDCCGGRSVGMVVTHIAADGHNVTDYTISSEKDVYRIPIHQA